MAGTGGVGKGILFRLQGTHPLGKNESRAAELTDSADFCKLHIILHYVAAFAGADVPVYAVSCVGSDETGAELLALMEKSGIRTAFMRTDAERKTMYSVCYQFPGGEGGNITAVNGANNQVRAKDEEAFFRTPAAAGRGIVLSAPEVPLEARIAMLREGRRHGALTVSSVLSGEMESFSRMGGFALTDLLAVNEDEAAALAQALPGAPGDDPAARSFHALQRQNPQLLLAVTRGKRCSVLYHGEKCQSRPGIPVEAVNTAGAGDCYLGVLIAALLKGIPVFRTPGMEEDIASAQDLATLASAAKVRCPDTIDFSLGAQTAARFAREQGLTVSPLVRDRFLCQP